MNYYGYNAELTNTKTGLQYLRVRYYDPENGNFTSEDTEDGELPFPLTRNRYAYALNNPLNYKDPTGRKSNAVNETSWKAVGVISGAMGKMMGKAITKGVNQVHDTVAKANKMRESRPVKPTKSSRPNVKDKDGSAGGRVKETFSSFGISVAWTVEQIKEKANHILCEYGDRIGEHVVNSVEDAIHKTFPFIATASNAIKTDVGILQFLSNVKITYKGATWMDKLQYSIGLERRGLFLYI